MNSSKTHLFLAAFVLPLSLSACLSSSKSNSGSDPVTAQVTAHVCPANYVAVPGDPNFSTSDFCIAKFEAKNVGGIAESIPGGTPWGNVNRDQAIAACALNGANYSLVDNAHYMTAARSIEATAWNWGNSGTLYGVSHGLSLNTSASAPFAASTDDTVACYLAQEDTSGLMANCDLNTFDSSRRILKLANGSLIWDLVGNVGEWMSDSIATNYGVSNWWLNVTDPTVKTLFGPSGTYPAGPANPPSTNTMYNFGVIGSAGAPTALARGGGFNYGRYAGLYSAFFTASPGTTGVDVGFRCMYQF